ncbi:hypothetical protein GCM10010383_36900 [Streptomyces lomondensis]|uniref:Uncharacterized protein n=1 Tax=Streptomyces lomondensis TaxID=68229 RepID=A0ABQ2X8C3_9ACTN|nr:hypothetical protein GCM10010383_36900 [Streptomyces lomondensis]
MVVRTGAAVFGGVFALGAALFALLSLLRSDFRLSIAEIGAVLAIVGSLNWPRRAARTETHRVYRGRLPGRMRAGWTGAGLRTGLVRLPPDGIHRWRHPSARCLPGRPAAATTVSPAAERGRPGGGAGLGVGEVGLEQDRLTGEPLAGSGAAGSSSAAWTISASLGVRLAAAASRA